MAIELLPFTIAEFLTDDETISEYLTIAFESNDPGEIIRAIGAVAEVRGGVDALARESGIEPEVWMEMLAKGSEPKLTTLLRMLHALGVKLSASMVA